MILPVAADILLRVVLLLFKKWFLCMYRNQSGQSEHTVDELLLRNFVYAWEREENLALMAMLFKVTNCLSEALHTLSKDAQ